MQSEKGDCAAHFNEVYDRTFNELERFTALRCSDPAYISDLLQDVYLDYYRLLESRGAEQVRNDAALLKKIAKRKLMRYYSLKQRMRRLVPLFRQDEDGGEYCVAEAADDCAEDEILTALESERIWGVINGYPADVRKIMYLYFRCGMTLSQIAGELGCGLSNVKNKLYRTLAEIREKEKCND